MRGNSQIGRLAQTRQPFSNMNNASNNMGSIPSSERSIQRSPPISVKSANSFGSNNINNENIQNYNSNPTMTSEITPQQPVRSGIPKRASTLANRKSTASTIQNAAASEPVNSIDAVDLDDSFLRKTAQHDYSMPRQLPEGAVANLEKQQHLIENERNKKKIAMLEEQQQQQQQPRDQVPNVLSPIKGSNSPLKPRDNSIPGHIASFPSSHSHMTMSHPSTHDGMYLLNSHKLETRVPHSQFYTNHIDTRLDNGIVDSKFGSNYAKSQMHEPAGAINHLRQASSFVAAPKYSYDTYHQSLQSPAHASDSLHNLTACLDDFHSKLESKPHPRLTSHESTTAHSYDRLTHSFNHNRLPHEHNHHMFAHSTVSAPAPIHYSTPAPQAMVAPANIASQTHHLTSFAVPAPPQPKHDSAIVTTTIAPPAPAAAVPTANLTKKFDNLQADEKKYLLYLYLKSQEDQSVKNFFQTVINVEPKSLFIERLRTYMNTDAVYQKESGMSKEAAQEPSLEDQLKQLFQDTQPRKVSSPVSKSTPALICPTSQTLTSNSNVVIPSKQALKRESPKVKSVAKNASIQVSPSRFSRENESSDLDSESNSQKIKEKPITKTRSKAVNDEKRKSAAKYNCSSGHGDSDSDSYSTLNKRGIDYAEDRRRHYEDGIGIGERFRERVSDDVGYSNMNKLKWRDDIISSDYLNGSRPVDKNRHIDDFRFSGDDLMHHAYCQSRGERSQRNGYGLDHNIRSFMPNDRFGYERLGGQVKDNFTNVSNAKLTCDEYEEENECNVSMATTISMTSHDHSHPNMRINDANTFYIRETMNLNGHKPSKKMMEIKLTALPGQNSSASLPFCNKKSESIIVSATPIVVRFDPLVHSNNTSHLDSANLLEVFTVSPNFYLHPQSEGSVVIRFHPIANVAGVYSGALKVRAGKKTFMFVLRGEVHVDQMKNSSGYSCDVNENAASNQSPMSNDHFMASESNHATNVSSEKNQLQVAPSISESTEVSPKEIRQVPFVTSSPVGTYSATSNGVNEQRKENLQDEVPDETSLYGLTCDKSSLELEALVTRSLVESSDQRFSIFSEGDLVITNTSSSSTIIKIQPSKPNLRPSKNNFSLRTGQSERIRIFAEINGAILKTAGCGVFIHLGLLALTNSLGEELVVDIKVVSRVDHEAEQVHNMSSNNSKVTEKMCSSVNGGIRDACLREDLGESAEINTRNEKHRGRGQVDRSVEVVQTSPSKTSKDRSPKRIDFSPLMGKNYREYMNGGFNAYSKSNDEVKISKDSQIISRVNEHSINTQKSGRISCNIQFAKREINIGSHPKGMLHRFTVELRNRSNQDLTIYFSESASPFFNFVEEDIRMKARTYVLLPMRFIPIEVGSFTYTLTATTEDGKSSASIILQASSY